MTRAALASGHVLGNSSADERRMVLFSLTRLFGMDLELGALSFMIPSFVLKTCFPPSFVVA